MPTLLKRFATKIVRRTLLAVLAVMAAANMVSAQTVTVQIQQSTAFVSTSVVTIGDIAKLECANPAMAEKLGKLELDVFSATARRLDVSRQQIFWRLVLAGIDQERLNIQGHDHVAVAFLPESEIDSAITRWLTGELAAGFGIATDSLSVQLPGDPGLQRMRQAWLAMSTNPARLRLPNQLVAGEQSLMLETTTPGGTATLLAWPVTITLQQSVAVARRRIPVNTIITADDVQNVQRPISDRQVRPVSAEEVVGRSVNREFHPLELLDRRSVTTRAVTAAPPVQNAVTVRAGSPVTILHRIGRMEIKIKGGKTLQSGTVGSTVEVENVSTRKRMNCRIVDERTVELIR